MSDHHPPRRWIAAVALLALAVGALPNPVCARSRGGGHGPQSGVQSSGDTIDVSDDHGGSVAQYDGMWRELAAQGKTVRVVGPCQSACTTLLGHVPRERLCVTPAATFGFHKARVPAMTQVMWNGYPSGVRRWINDHGGLSETFLWMSAPDTYRYFRQCPSG